ncbi:helix-turn-helix domain-containing protein [Paenibacillus sp. HB172176]|uniref:helix-turn-helix domain-containing protein n=1 Tax=Paenibacillus sp. HB172176 TaxID=2493690 RepID=UPI00143A8EEF|nr:helix-turn-helix domain-containing protein [Paenibacillus sp. HB172176]
MFWRFFVTFLVFILVPSMLASLFIYTYVTSLLEREMEKSSQIVIGHFADRTDEMINALQNDMIKLLGYPGLDRYLRMQDEESDSIDRNELLGTFMSQMSAMVAGHPLASDAYLVLTGHDLVVHPTGSFGKQVFFSYINHFADMSEDQLQTMFSGTKMMSFTAMRTVEEFALYDNLKLNSGRYTSAIMSYPYNSPDPKAYLVVNVDAEQLRSQIQIRNSNLFETAIVSRSGEVLTYTGEGMPSSEALMRAITSDNGSEVRIRTGDREWRAFGHQLGRHDWFYVGLTDIKELNRTGDQIKRGSILLLLLFLLAGTMLSFLVSRRMHTPIREIKEELETGRRKANLPHDMPGNELEQIRSWAKHLMLEHQDMSVQINGMSPIMHEIFLGKILLGEFRDELSIDYYAKEIGFRMLPQLDLAALCIELVFAVDVTETGKSYLMVDLKNKLERLLRDEVWLCSLHKDLLVCVLQLRRGEDSDRESLEKADEIAELLGRQSDRYRAAIGVGGKVATMAELHRSYQRGKRLLRLKSLDESVIVYSGLAEPEEKTTLDSFLPAEQISQLLNWYRGGHYSAMLEHALERIEQAESQNAAAVSVKQLSSDMLNAWIRTVAADNRHDFSLEQFTALYMRLEECSTWEELRRFFRDTASELFVETETGSRAEQFRESADYIRTHYAEDLTIEQLASGMNMSVGHFSRSFKDAIGEKYIDYLTRCRIEAAQQLLLESDKRIDDIAIEVGYLGRNSFIKTFRKQVGITPGKYREACKSGS